MSHGCYNRAPAHLSAYPSGDCVPRISCPLAVYIIDSIFILENIDDGNGQGAKVGLRPQPKGCQRRAPAHLSAFSSGDCVPRTPCPLAVYIIDSIFILEYIDDGNGQGTIALIEMIRRQKEHIDGRQPYILFL